MSQGQSKEKEHLINTYGFGLSSVPPHRAMMPASFLLCHVFNSFLRLWIKSIWNQWDTFCRFQRALDQVWRRKCRSGSTNLSCFSFYFLICLNFRREHAIFHLFSSSPGLWATRAWHCVIGLSDQQGTVCLPFSWLPPTRCSFPFSLRDTAKKTIWHRVASGLRWTSDASVFLCPDTVWVFVRINLPLALLLQNVSEFKDIYDRWCPPEGIATIT